MKILFISHSASLTGAPLLLYEIASRINISKYKSVFLLPEEGAISGMFRSLGETFIEPLYPDEVKYWREIKRISSRIQLLRRIKPHIVYCNTIHPAKWLVYARLLGIPTITHVHELSMGFAALSRLEYFWVKNFSQHFIAVSAAVKNYLVEHHRISPEKVTVVHAGIDVHRFGNTGKVNNIKKSLGIKDELIIGTFGRITSMKGSDLFLRLALSIKQSLSNSTNVKFLVIGTTEDKEFYNSFISLLKELKLTKDVIFLENIRNISDYYPVIDIYVSTAREDPFPLVVLEAMASSKPVVSFSVGGIPEMLNEESGILIKEFNLDAMKEAILRLVYDSTMRKRIGAAARTRVERNFNIANNISKIEEIIDSTLIK